MNIDKSGKVYFTPEEHTYTYYPKNGGNPLIYDSVTTVIGQYECPFDVEYRSAVKAIQRLMGDSEFKARKKEFKRWGGKVLTEAFVEFLLKFVDWGEYVEMKQSVQYEWKHENLKATTKGTEYHKSQEERSYRAAAEINPFTQEAFDVAPEMDLPPGHNISRTEHLFDLPDGFYPELLVWNHDYHIAGQADKMFIQSKRKHRYVWVDDYKTNKKIRKRGFWNEDERKPFMMRDPVKHLQDCNYNKYNLQLSLYAWIMEQAGYKIAGIGFHHFNETYKLKYRKKEVQDILTDYEMYRNL